MRPIRFVALAAALGASACTDPRQQANMIQELNDAATEINGLKGDVADLETQLDSLRTILAKHDTSIARIANVNNVPIVR